MKFPLRAFHKNISPAGFALPFFILLLLAPPASGQNSDKTAGAKYPGVFERPLIGHWDTFTTSDGLPSNKAFAVKIDGDRVWVGTANGLSLYENGKWRSWGVEDGLPGKTVLALDVSPRNGDLWIGTMGGLARFSAGRIDAFTQMNSGLFTNFVNSVRCDPDEDAVWAVTAMGATRYDLNRNEWQVFNQANTPMHEPWVYTVQFGDGKIFVGAWGGGVLEYTKATGQWREYRDPDHEFIVDLFPDDGPVSDVTSGLDYGDGILWASTYTGLARYDGRNWRSYYQGDSGLASDFVQFVRSDGPNAWLGTDDGLSYTDGENWATYRALDDGRGEIVLTAGRKQIERKFTETGMPHNYVIGVDYNDREVWAATGEGVARGTLAAGVEPLGETFEIASANIGNRQSPFQPFVYSGMPQELVPYNPYPVYRHFFEKRIEFRGPGASKPDPAGLKEAPIGFIGPLEAEDYPVKSPGFKMTPAEEQKIPIGRSMLKASRLAVEQANANGGYKGIPFKIVPRTDLVLWGQTSGEMIDFVEQDKVWGIIGAIDSNHNHVMTRTSIKAEVPLVNAGTTDPTIVEHAIPWLVRTMSDDRQAAYAMIYEMFIARDLKKPALLRVNDRDGRVGVKEMVAGARRMKRPILFELRFDNGDTDFRKQLEKIKDSDSDSLILWGNPKETGAIVRQARGMGLNVPIFGFERMTLPEFLEAAGDAAEGVVAIAPMNPDSNDATWLKFKSDYKKRWGEEPNFFAAHAYDATNLLINAIREAGLNRPRIRNALFGLTEYHGAAGDILFDSVMSDMGPVWIAEVKNGKFKYREAKRWAETPLSASAGIAANAAK